MPLALYLYTSLHLRYCLGELMYFLGPLILIIMKGMVILLNVQVRVYSAVMPYRCAGLGFTKRRSRAW